MRISENVSVDAGMSLQHGQRTENINKTIFAGNLNQDIMGERIAQRKAQAKEQAMKVVMDAWEGDRAIDDDMRGRRDRIEKLRSEMQGAENQRKEIENRQKQFQENCGITPDSQEQRDLELLRKKKGYYPGGADLTEEEAAYATQLEAKGLTEYQQRQLDMDGEKQYYQDKYQECFEGIKQEIATINATRLERLKYSPMVKANRQAEEIEKAANEEVLSMLFEEGKEHIDEEQEERREQAEAVEEQREEQEAFIEAQKDKRKEAEEFLEEMPVEEILHINQSKTDIQKEVQNIVDKMKLVAEDIKGSVVDENI